MGKKRRTEEKSMKFPDDLIIDIISRVPAKDLLRLKCLSKSWCSFINSDSYLYQLRSQRTASLNQPILIIERTEKSGGGELYYNYWLELDSIEDGNPRHREIHNPFYDDNDCPRDAYVLDSCYGLLVLQQDPSSKMVVLSPTTKKRYVVPPNPAGDDNVIFCGFGYDHVHGCYKLVTKVKVVISHDHVAELMIYNVNICTWKKSRIDGFYDDEGYSQFFYPGEYVDGALYWDFSTRIGRTTILCFVLAEEEFHEVDLPRFDAGVFKSSITTVFDGRLCLVCKGRCDDRVEFRVEFWLMECDSKRQLGSSYSWRWIKFLSISDPIVKICRYPFPFPLCFSACENKILFDVDDELFWYDLGKNEFRKPRNRINNFSYRYCGIHATCWVPRLVGNCMS